MASEEIAGVILAAGKGSRMSPLPTRLPKPALPVLNRPIVYHQLQALHGVGIRTVYVVVGVRGYEIVREIERIPDLGLDIRYVEQTEAHGIAHCVGRLEPHIDSPFLLLLGDIYFDAPRLSEMTALLDDPGVDGALAAIEETSLDAIRRNFCIMADGQGRATGVAEKPRRPRSMTKGVGLYLFRPVVFDAIRRTPRTAMRDEYEITDSIQILIEDGCDVRVSRCVDHELNVTGPADLLDINLRLLGARGLDRLVAADAQVGEGAVVERAVIGEGARIGAGARVSNAVVFRDVEIQPGARVEHAVVTESGICSIPRVV